MSALCFLLLCALALLPALPAHAAPLAPTGDIQPNSAVAAPEWTTLFDRDSGWTGADGVYTVPLNGDERNGAAGQTSTFFVFSDTFIGGVNPNGSRAGGTVMVNNTMARLYGSAPDPAQLTFFWGDNGSGGAASRVLPPTSGNWYWPIDGIALHDTLYMFNLLMRSDATTGFAVIGIDLLRSSLRSAEPFSDYTRLSTPLYAPASGNHGDAYYGIALTPNTAEAGAPYPDGYLYIYGVRNDALSKKLLVARVRPENIENFADYRYWDGHSWQPDITRARAVYDRVSSEFSVTPLADGRYLLVFHLDAIGDKVAVSYGASPVGPWGPPIAIWTCPEDTMTRSTFTYGSKAHPHLSAPGELLISYHVNTSKSQENWNNAEIYRPRFIRVNLNQGEASAAQISEPSAPDASSDLDPAFGVGGKVETRIGKGDEGGAAAARQSDGKIVVVGRGSGGGFAVARYDADGALDVSFGSGGIVTTDFAGEEDNASAVAVQADGKILVAGSASTGGRSDFAVARYLANGQLDTSFAGDGKQTVDFAGSDDVANALAIQSDGRLILAGSALVDGSQRDVALARLNADGSLDTGFGGGRITTDVGGVGNAANALALQSDGKIVVAGANFTGYKAADDMLALRYMAAGALDAGFDGDGIATVDFAGAGDAARAVAVQPDGKIVLGGSAFTGANDDDFALARLNPNGGLDSSFGGDGKATTDFAGAYDFVSALALTPDGKVLAAGRARGATEDFAAARYNADGSLDVGFDSDGLLTTDFASSADEAASVLLLPDARFVLAGTAGVASDDFALAGYSANGGLDATFDGDGKAATDFALGQSVIYALAQQSDGKIIAAGAQRVGRSSGNSFTVARYLPSGALDASFGAGGVSVVDFGAPSEAHGVALQPDGKIIVAGRGGSGQNGQFALARLNPNGELDASFGSGGTVATTFTEGGSAASALALQSDGKIVVAGIIGTGPSDFAFARYNPNGSLDTTFSSDGLATVDINTAADAGWSVALQPDGKIVAAGYAYTGASSDFALVRLNGDGSLDAGFDGDGKLMTDFGDANSFAYGATVLSDGRIAVAGEVETNGGDIALALYNAGGGLDATFDGDGKTTADFGARESATGLALGDDGKLLIGGRKQASDGRDDFLAARFNLDGSLDTGLGAGGATTVSFDGSEARAFALLPQSDGGIILAGQTDNFALARLLGRLPLDVTISADGADVVLSWTMASAATKCEVWRASVPYFAPGDGSAALAGTISPCGAGAVTWRDANRIGDAEVNWSYRVRTIGAAEGDSTSTEDGEFDFDLMR